jgi:rRNA maturation endonuclease Nob1
VARIRKLLLVTQSQMQLAMSNVKAWQCYVCQKVYNEATEKCSGCGGWTVEPLLRMQVSKNCPSCGQELK